MTKNADLCVKIISMKLSAFIVTFLLVMTIYLFGCTKDKITYQTDSCMGTNWVHDDFTILPLTGIDHPYILGYSIPPSGYTLDDQGVPLFEYEGENYYHPVYMSQFGFKQLDWFRSTGDSAYFFRAVSTASRLKQMAVSKDSSVLFPNPFDFNVHSLNHELMEAPWLSAMTQGQALSLFCWLHDLTGDSNYMIWAEKIYNSYYRLKGSGHSDWVSCVDDNANIWMEEYPSDTPSFTLNGKIFAIIGLYDYYIATGDQEAKNILMAGITTIKNNVHRFRQENAPSLYCIKHQKSYTGYHQTHINLLRTLHAMTQDPYFEEMAITFEDDYQE